MENKLSPSFCSIKCSVFNQQMNVWALICMVENIEKQMNMIKKYFFHHMHERLTQVSFVNNNKSLLVSDWKWITIVGWHLKAVTPWKFTKPHVNPAIPFDFCSENCLPRNLVDQGWPVSQVLIPIANRSCSTWALLEPLVHMRVVSIGLLLSFCSFL